MDIAGRSHKGFIRVNNQDNYLITQNSQGDTLAIVCDGIGGAKAGDVASLMATKFIGESFASIEGFDSITDGEAWFKEAIKKANDKIFTATATSDDYAGMGTTLVGALI
ncbi:MAG TPA: protein phosphatase 2C domain-containing protein, partial [Erysipelotrichaceae bacterium]|nr:protein phosphatase 2C domain-containing protein [Erysipelotrichaceae bacterium]